jgi:hypothetical protein
MLLKIIKKNLIQIIFLIFSNLFDVINVKNIFKKKKTTTQNTIQAES